MGGTGARIAHIRWLGQRSEGQTAGAETIAQLTGNLWASVSPLPVNEQAG